MNNLECNFILMNILSLNGNMKVKKRVETKKIETLDSIVKDKNTPAM